MKNKNYEETIVRESDYFNENEGWELVEEKIEKVSMGFIFGDKLVKVKKYRRNITPVTLTATAKVTIPKWKFDQVKDDEKELEQTIRWNINKIKITNLE